jgi:hypothetical protein
MQKVDQVMRIISQDKEFDLPYEETTLRAFANGEIGAFPLIDLESNDFIVMAKYSTQEKAIKAMEMCRKRYTQYIFNRRMVTVAANDLTRIPLEEAEKVRDQISETFIFQFPKEEEVEDE